MEYISQDQQTSNRLMSLNWHLECDYQQNQVNSYQQHHHHQFEWPPRVPIGPVEMQQLQQLKQFQIDQLNQLNQLTSLTYCRQSSGEQEPTPLPAQQAPLAAHLISSTPNGNQLIPIALIQLCPLLAHRTQSSGQAWWLTSSDSSGSQSALDLRLKQLDVQSKPMEEGDSLQIEKAKCDIKLLRETETSDKTKQCKRLALVAPAKRSGRKYNRSEFDDPSSEQVELRLRHLFRQQDNYHLVNTSNASGQCACLLGSHFKNGKSSAQMLEQMDRWRRLDTKQRVQFKWNLDDLPEEIELSQIKRLETLRCAASRGRADFGGTSKRKPLGIRGTRQFLLMLYCLWGHPGGRDEMQREGYCPHCLARIQQPNEQSTLVRVVNHFNMKHRLGANPRKLLELSTKTR